MRQNQNSFSIFLRVSWVVVMSGLPPPFHRYMPTYAALNFVRRGAQQKKNIREKQKQFILYVQHLETTPSLRRRHLLCISICNCNCILYTSLHPSVQCRLNELRCERVFWYFRSWDHLGHVFFVSAHLANAA